MTELEIEANAALKFEFDKITEAGVQLEPLYGPGYTGMINLGNRCVKIVLFFCCIKSQERKTPPDFFFFLIL